jgi:hypothetical protein
MVQDGMTLTTITYQNYWRNKDCIPFANTNSFRLLRIQVVVYSPTEIFAGHFIKRDVDVRRVFP